MCLFLLSINVRHSVLQSRTTKKKKKRKWYGTILTFGKLSGCLFRFVCLFGRSRVLRNLRHYLRTQSQGHYTIDHLQEQDVDSRSARVFSLKEIKRAIMRRTSIGTVSKATL